MKKFILGTLFGLALSLTIPAYASVESMIGKIVEGTFPVNIDGKTLSNEAIVIEGSSYLPVRVVGDAIGYEVDFKNKEVILTKPTEDIKLQGQSKPPEVKPVEQPTNNVTIEELNTRIEAVQVRIQAQKAGLSALSSDDQRREFFEDTLKDFELQLEQLQQQKAELEK